jgi:hypothetical protein
MSAIDMPTDMPDISMPELEDEDIDQLDDITLAEAIREARRRKRIRKLHPASARQTSMGSPPPSPTTDPENQRFYADPITPNSIDNMQPEHRCVRRRLNNDDEHVDNIFTGPAFFGKTHVKDIIDLLSNTSLSTHMSKIHYDQIKAPVKGIAREDMLEDPCDLDQLSRFLYQVHERLSGGLHYNCY